MNVGTYTYNNLHIRGGSKYMTLYYYKTFFKEYLGLNNNHYCQYTGILPTCISREVWVHQLSLYQNINGVEGRYGFKSSQIISINEVK